MGHSAVTIGSSWGIAEANPTLLGVVVAVFAALALVVTGQRLLQMRSRRRHHRPHRERRGS